MYGFEAGKTYTYQIKIEAQTPEYTETITGESIYNIKLVDAKSGHMTLTHSATLNPQRQYRQQAGIRRIGPPTMGPNLSFSSYNQPREIIIDPRGGIVRYEVKMQLPYLLGSAVGLLVEPLAENDQPKWQVKREVEITATDMERLFLPRPMPAKATARSARETIDYSISGKKGGMVKIERKSVLATLEMVDGEPALQQSGSAIIEFDSKAGMVRTLQSKTTTLINDPGVTIKIPVSVSARLITEQEMALIQQQRRDALAKREQAMKEEKEKQRQQLAKTNPEMAAKQAELDRISEEMQKPGADFEKLQPQFTKLIAEMAKMHQAAAKGPKPTPIDDAAIDAALADLKRADRMLVSKGAQTLARAVPVEKRRAEVAKALEALLAERDPFARKEAIAALGGWGTPQTVPKLIAVLNEDDVFSQMAAIEALASLKDERGAEAIAKLLPQQQLRHQAKEAMLAFGPVAEKHVSALLKHKDWTMRMEACDILAEIGTALSLEPLKLAADDGNDLVSRKAEDALRAVQGRK